jgi:hypothetical protein
VRRWRKELERKQRGSGRRPEAKKKSHDNEVQKLPLPVL